MSDCKLSSELVGVISEKGEPSDTPEVSKPTKLPLYRRNLPSSCVSFSSDEGKHIFTESLLSGHANIYFPLAEQFRTQDEPAYNGLSTLVMVLNALAVDPKRIWKGPWRWYYEDMLNCCFPQDLVDQQSGTTIDQFARLAVCNNLDLNVVISKEDASVEDFRKAVKAICATDDKVLVCCYSRRVLGQIGNGHFTPIGAYYPKEDLILVLDVERYKYPPHWVPLTNMWKAMKSKDKLTGSPRGYIVMRKTLEMPSLLFRLSTTFRVTIATHNLMKSPMTMFVKSWKSFLTEERDCTNVNLEEVITNTLEVLHEALAVLVDDESVFTTQFDTCCVADVPIDFVDNVKCLLKDLEGKNLFQVIDRWVESYKANGRDKKANCPKVKKCAKKVCCRLKKLGKSVPVGDIEEVLTVDTNSKSTQCSKDKRKPASTCNKSKEKQLVNESHYISMILLSWPYDVEPLLSPYVKILMNYMMEIIGDSTGILQNEVYQLKQQILSVVSMVKCYGNDFIDDRNETK